MQYELIIATDPPQQRVTLRLLDDHGVQRGRSRYVYRAQPSVVGGTVRYPPLCVAPSGQSAAGRPDPPGDGGAVAGASGLFLGKQVLGAEIMQAPTQTAQRRTLLVRLPPTADDVLAAAFARVPCEIARPGVGSRPCWSAL